MPFCRPYIACRVGNVFFKMPHTLLKSMGNTNFFLHAVHQSPALGKSKKNTLQLSLPAFQ